MTPSLKERIALKMLIFTYALLLEMPTYKYL